MADLEYYKTLDEKRKYFSNGNSKYFKIDNKENIDDWFSRIEEKLVNVNPTMFIYRGVSEAKYKLYTSAQRLWIVNEYKQWAKKDYLRFINDLVEYAKSNYLIKRVFDLHNYSNSEREFPILSLLQHYGAPSPLMDWTYNKFVASFFATEGLNLNNPPKQNIDDYFSIYSINKERYDELLNIIDFLPKNKYPSFNMFYDFGRSHSNNRNAVFYISDFEEKRGTLKSKQLKKMIIRTRRPITTVYNQNIIPQEGLFIFNPYSEKTLENIFNVNIGEEGWNLLLSPFECYNINKGLGEYLRRKISVKHHITNGFIYPNLYDQIKQIKENAINGLLM